MVTGIPDEVTAVSPLKVPPEMVSGAPLDWIVVVFVPATPPNDPLASVRPAPLAPIVMSGLKVPPEM